MNNKETLREKAGIGLGLFSIAFVSRFVVPNEVAHLLGGDHNVRAALEHTLTATSFVLLNPAVPRYLISKIIKKSSKQPEELLTKEKKEREGKVDSLISALNYIIIMGNFEVFGQYFARGYVQWEQIVADIGGLAIGIKLASEINSRKLKNDDPST